MNGPYSEELITKTQRFWSEYSGKKLSRDDAIECIRNVTAYMKILIRWDRERTEAADTRSPSPNNDREQPAQFDPEDRKS